jgi:hypothetical protein
VKRFLGVSSHLGRGCEKLIEEQEQLTQRRQDAKGRQANNGVILCASFASLRLCVRFFIYSHLLARGRGQRLSPSTLLLLSTFTSSQMYKLQNAPASWLVKKRQRAAPAPALRTSRPECAGHRGSWLFPRHWGGDKQPIGVRIRRCTTDTSRVHCTLPHVGFQTSSNGTPGPG